MEVIEFDKLERIKFGEKLTYCWVKTQRINKPENPGTVRETEQKFPSEDKHTGGIRNSARNGSKESVGRV